MDREFSYAKSEWYVSANWHCFWWNHAFSSISILLIKVCMRSWSRLAQALCKMRWSSPGDLARSPDCNPIENSMLKRCREVIEGDGGPINYWTLHSLWCLLKEKHGVTCNKWCNKWKHAWFPCYSCRSCHKSQKCKIFFHTLCLTRTMPSIGRHIPLLFCVRKFPIHYRLNDQIVKILFEIFEKVLGGTYFFGVYSSVYSYICSPLRVQNCSFHLCTPQKCFYDNWKHEYYLGFNICTPINDVGSVLPKGAPSVTIYGANLNHYLLVWTSGISSGSLDILYKTSDHY